MEHPLGRDPSAGTMPLGWDPNVHFLRIVKYLLAKSLICRNIWPPTQSVSAVPPPRTTGEVSQTDLLEPIRDVSHAVIQLLAPRLIEAGLDPHTFWPLHHLTQGEIRHPGELARRLGVSPATCTATVDRLVVMGLVVRQPSEGDRRQVVLVVTPKGHRVLDAVWRRFDVALREVLVGIPSRDLAVTGRTLRAISEQLRSGGFASSRENRS